MKTPLQACWLQTNWLNSSNEQSRDCPDKSFLAVTLSSSWQWRLCQDHRVDSSAVTWHLLLDSKNPAAQSLSHHKKSCASKQWLNIVQSSCRLSASQHHSSPLNCTKNRPLRGRCCSGVWLFYDIETTTACFQCCLRQNAWLFQRSLATRFPYPRLLYWLLDTFFFP